MNKKLTIKTVDEKATARILGVAVQTLRNWRHHRKGPAYIKMGRSVRYQIKDLQEYIDVRRIDPSNRKIIINLK